MEENIDYVICKICGKHFKSLSGHIKIHNINAKEYVNKYLSPIKCQKSINKFISSRAGWHHTTETKTKMSNKMSGENHPCYGRKHTKEEKEKIKTSVKNKWEDEDFINKQKNGYTQESRNKISASSKNYQYNCGGREKTSISIKKLWKTKEHQIKMQKAFKLHPNNPETILIKLFEVLNKPLKFVGDFNYWIDGKNPDFIDVDNKIIIELYGDYWHRNEKNDNGKKRIDHFNKSGFATIIIWESELKNIESVKLKIEEIYKQEKLDVDGRVK